jgi:hypothetical protein
MTHSGYSPSCLEGKLCEVQQEMVHLRDARQLRWSASWLEELAGELRLRGRRSL